METKKGELLKNENKLPKGLVILTVIIIMFGLGCFAGQAAYHLIN